MTHAIHKRLSSPTGVEHCVKATFVSPNQINLIVGRTTVLQIYALRRPSKPKDDSKHPIARLDLIREFQLFGNVQALGVVRLPDKMTDSLVLGFPDAKISIVEWNPAIDELEITGLHFYENEEQLKEGHCRVVNKPQLVVSHDSKCAVMLSYERQLIVVPFRPESAHLDQNVIYSEVDIARKFPSTYVVHLPTIGVLHVKDMAFLEGYYEPTLLILYEPFQTYGTRLPSRKNTACITALSLNLNKKTHPVVWSKCNLPYDACTIIPVPLPIGGVIVIGSNSVFYFNQTTDYGMTFNHFGDTQGSPYRTDKSDIVLVLDNACGTWLNTDSLLLSVDGGDLYLLRLFTDGRTVTRFTIESKNMIEKRAYNVREEVPMVEKISPGTIASCMCTLSEEFIFIGSHVGDSNLVQYREKIIPVIKQEQENNGEGGGNVNGERPSKRTKLTHNGDDPTVKQEEDRPLDRQKPYEVDRIRKFENDGLREDPNETSQNRKLDGLPENGEATDDPWKDLESSVETDEDLKLINVFRESYQQRNWESMHKKKDYELEICDILPNIGPIVDVTIQPSLDDATVSTIEETDEKIFNTKSRRKVELVCCSGRGKNGALTIIQRGVRPEINTSVEVPGCRALWGVFHRTRTDENVRSAEEEILWTRYLVLSRDDRTMVLETGDIIQEISNKVEFFTDGPTQNVGNLFNNHRIAQVHSNGVILLDGVMRTQEWTVPSPEFTVIASSIKDPYVLLQLNNRSLILLEAVVKQSDFNLVNTGITFDNQSPVSAFYLFRDESCCPIFNTTKEEAEHRQHRVKLSKRKRQSTSTVTTAPLSAPMAAASTVAKMISGIAELPGLKNKVEDPFSHAMNNDPEELEIYGYNNNLPGTPDFYTDETIPPDSIVRPFYCALTLDDGIIQIYRFVKPDNTDSNKGKGQTGEDDQNQELEREALSSVERVFHASRFSDGPSLISDESLDYIEAIDVGSGRNKKRHNIFVVELGLFSMGSYHLPPNLFAFLNNGDLLVYQCFYYTSKHKDSIPLRLRRIEQNMLFRNFKRPIRKIKKEKKSKKKKEKDEESSDAEVEEWVDENPNFAILSTANDYRPTDIRYSRMVSFDNIADRRGLFIVGIRPVWVFCERDSLRFHPMTVDGRINSFTPFHNVSNRRGFIYYTETQSRMKICQLNPLWEMELSCPFRKLPLGSNITHITYDAATQLLIVVTEKPVKDKKLYYQPEIVANEDLEKPLPEEEILSKPLPERLPELTQDQFQMHLLSPENWTILNTFHFHKEERVLSAKVCNLNVKQNEKTVSQAFLAVGTAYVRGEDLGAQGRILVFDILRPRDVTQSKFELLFEKSERGPISCVAQLDGLLLCAIGMKILLFQFSDRKSLVGVAFFDCQILIVDAVSIKNYVILGDMYKSIYFLRWKDRARQLELLAKDYDPLNVLATQFLVDDKTVTFLVCDTEMNMHMFGYAPRDKESRGGQKLLCSGNFYLGASVNRFLRLRMNHLRTNTKIPVNKHCALYTTLDGGIGYIAPIEKEKFDKLGRLEMRMVSALQHVAGLNPKAFRLTKPWLKMSHNHQRSVIDGELLWRFAFMERQKQDELADSVGTTTEEVIDFLMEIDACTSFF